MKVYLMTFDPTNQDGVYRAKEHTHCPECETKLKGFGGNGAAAEGFGSRRADRMVYCPSCTPRSMIDKVRNFISDL